MLRACLVSAIVFALTLPRLALASPGVEGTRNLGLAGVARSSSYGTNSVLINPSNMGFSQVFAIEPMYQVHLASRTHGVGIVIMDSLNNSRIALGLGYLFLKGAPTIRFALDTGDERRLELSRFGHEVLGALEIMVVKRWLAVGLKPKYQYVSLRYRDDIGLARNAHRRLNAFGLDTSVTANFAGWAAVSVLANNVTGNHPPAYNDGRDVRLVDVGYAGGPIDYSRLPALSEYPLTFEHGLSVFPLHHPDLSINFDGMYDFTTYSFENHTRIGLGGSAEYVLGPVPLRFGTLWDGRGKGDEDDRVYVAGGVAYVKQPSVGGVGVDVGFGFRQQVTGPDLDTFLGFNLGIRIHPDL